MFIGTCELCERENTDLTIHHLIPKEEGGLKLATANLCVPCHKQIHALYTNKELALRLNTTEKLKCDENILKFLKFIRKQHYNNTISIKRSTDKTMKKKYK